MKTAHCISPYRPLTPTAARATLACSRSFLMTCCVTLVCNTALSLIRGYFIASLQTRLSVFLSSSSSSSRPSLFSSPPLSVLPTCQSQLGLIPVAWAVLIDLASPPLREPLQLSRLGDASSIRYLTVNEVLPLQSNTFRVSLTALLASSSSFICPPARLQSAYRGSPVSIHAVAPLICSLHGIDVVRSQHPASPEDYAHAVYC